MAFLNVFLLPKREKKKEKRWALPARCSDRAREPSKSHTATVRSLGEDAGEDATGSLTTIPFVIKGQCRDILATTESLLRTPGKVL
jgi:hypothetical protein